MKIVVALPLALTFLFGTSAAVSAHVRYHQVRYHHFHRHDAYRYHRHRHFATNSEHHGHGLGLVHEKTAAGEITVAADVAGKFKDLIAALVAKGFHGSVGCYSATGHMPNSLHHSGRACDFAQEGRNRTVSIMYHSGDLIRKFGLRDGCSFGDCGHVDTGLSFARRERGHHAFRYAEHRRERGRYAVRYAVRRHAYRQERAARDYEGYRTAYGYDGRRLADSEERPYRVASYRRGRGYGRRGGLSYASDRETWR